MESYGTHWASHSDLFGLKFDHNPLMWQTSMQSAFFGGKLRADLHDTTLSPATSLRQTYDCRVRHKKCRTILNHVLKRCENPSRNPCRKLVACDKVVPCKSALRWQHVNASAAFDYTTLLLTSSPDLQHSCWLPASNEQFSRSHQS